MPYTMDSRNFRPKNPRMSFFCPLCTTARSFVHSPRLSRQQYIQLAFSSVLLLALGWKVMEVYALIFPCALWAGMEFWVRARFRKEIPCPHCGFDASWYKRDVKVARRLVQEFWSKQ
jgi:hypothetical protein